VSSLPTERKLAAILSADVVGYSRLMAEDEPGTIRTLTSYREAIGSLVSQHHGRVVDSPGDNLLAEFPNALDAVQCAVEIQGVLRVRNQSLPKGSSMLFRIGVHLGDITKEGDHVYGDGVNIAARLEGLAEAGGVCISANVYDLVHSKLDLGFEDLGEQSVKNIPDPVRAYRIQMDRAAPAPASRARSGRRSAIGAGAALLLVAAVSVWWLYVPRPGPIPDSGAIRSIAVLPLENLSGDPEQDYFVAGMHEALISSLARIGTGLRIISRTSVIEIDREGKSIREIAAQLGVDGVIEGSAMREGDQVRITVQLIDARRDDHLWAQSYDREFSSALALTREISRSVAGQIRLVLSPERERMLADTRPVDSQALDLYLSGAQHLSRVTVPDARRAVELFEASIAADPSFARAYEGLARAYMDLMSNLWAIAPEEALPKMRGAASRAVELDGTLAESHALLARTRWYMEFDWVETEASLSRALALEPMNVHVIGAYSWFLQCSGRIEEGLELMKRAVAADPVNLVTRMEFGWRLYTARRFERVIEESNQMLKIDPGFARAYDLLASSYAALGDLEASHDAYGRYEKLTGRPPWFLQAADRGYKQGGFKGRSSELLATVRRHDDGTISHVVRAFMACGAQEPGEAFVELNHALRRRDPIIVSIGVFPQIDCVRADPRFEELLRKINWPGLDG
jgi:class 3 adenylate cyclase/TolB-like protein/Tfp pilus assembly protein PilF